MTTPPDPQIGSSPIRDAPLIGKVAAPALQAMSWNVRRRGRYLSLRKADRWHHRGPRLQALLQAELPTVLGAQEAMSDQAAFIRDSLGTNYRYVGDGRDTDGGGEGCPIFYDAARLELLDWNQTALSQTPTRPGSRSWGSVFPRILVSATFRDHATSRSFLAVNTHLDPFSSRSRLQSARAIRAVASASTLPVLVTGDMNASATSAPLRELLAGRTLLDTWTAAQTRDSEQWGTFANYRTPRQDRHRIDWVLASPAFDVVRAAINARRPAGGWASDHLPVQAVLILPENGSGS